MLAFSCGGVLLYSVLQWGKVSGPCAHKILDSLAFALLLIAAIANHLFASMGTYLRAHKQEVLVQLSFAIALAVLLSNYIFARSIGAGGMVAGYLVIICVGGLGGGSLRFIKYSSLWHSAGWFPERAVEG